MGLIVSSGEAGKLTAGPAEKPPGWFLGVGAARLTSEAATSRLGPAPPRDSPGQRRKRLLIPRAGEVLPYLSGKLCESQPRQANRSSPSRPSRDGQSRSGAAEPQATEKMLASPVHPLLWLLGCTLVRGQPQSTTHSPEVKNHTSEPAVKATPPTNLNLTSAGQATTAKSSSVATTLLALTAQDEKSNGSRSTAASPPQGQEPKRSESTTTPATQGTSKPVTPTLMSSGYLPVPTPTDDKSPLTVAAFGVISFIVILIVVVIILVSVVSLRFKCNRSKDSEDKQKPGSSMVSESCSAGTSQNSITLISMKNINMNNSMSYPPSEKVSLLSLTFLELAGDYLSCWIRPCL
ncbi:endothelial cell-specific chemotaxis regulator [Egretta garzetta]|uniref:endothelial cell-specific chemotaxis regulator n=1 Tax=Egretta garzetta TaxID=188379 RepID=UPI00163CA933|nr:endothelial cell-specific chemotaxis regulator [Egretta garzetta]